MPGFIPDVTAGSSVAKELAKAFDKLPYDKDHFVKNGWKLDGKIYSDNQTDYDVGVQHFELYPTKIPGMFVRNFEALEVNYKNLDIVFVDATKLEKNAKLRVVIDTRDNLPDKNIIKTKFLKPKANRQKKIEKDDKLLGKKERIDNSGFSGGME